MKPFAFILCASMLGSPGDEPVDFDTDILAVLTKAGCNAAACHGAADGRGGFKLSLFGGDPTSDYDAIVRELEGRRVNHAQPDASLLLLKPTEQLEHEGGMRFEYDSRQAGLIAAWISQGAARARVRKLAELQVHPLAIETDDLAGVHQLRVTAVFDDGSARDVTSQSVFTPADPEAVAVSDDGVLRLQRGGRHAVAIRYLSQVQTIQATAPVRSETVDRSSMGRRNWIDDEINDTLAALHLPPAPVADDAALLRRVTLDLTGRLPSPEMVRKYAASHDDQKYDQLVENLLSSSEFSQYWTYQFAKLLRIRAATDDRKLGARKFHDWLREQIESGVGLDEVTVQMLTAAGDTRKIGPANFYLVANDARGQAEYVSEALMGVRLRCANCHNHPLDFWTQDDYHGLAAVFAKVEQGNIVRVNDRGEVVHPRTGESAAPRIPGERFLPSRSDERSEFAEWLVDSGNPYFARAHANRLWKAMMGRGLVEPTDDLRNTNPATHPQLLARLADDFAAHGFDIRHTLRTIAHSAAYRRSSRATSENEADDRFYSHALEKPLEPEVLLDAISDVSGIPERFSGMRRSTRAVDVFNTPEYSEALDILGRCSRVDSCESTTGAAGGLTTMLHLINGELINQRLVARDGRLRMQLAAGDDTLAIVEDFYLRALSRHPGDAEARYWQEQLKADDPLEHRRRLEDFVWSLLCCREFRTNH